MAGGKPKNLNKTGCIYFDDKRKRYMAQYYILDNETHKKKKECENLLNEKMMQKTF